MIEKLNYGNTQKAEPGNKIIFTDTVLMFLPVFFTLNWMWLYLMEKIKPQEFGI
jgi:hypothetical protein